MQNMMLLKKNKGFIEGRIIELESKLSNSIVINPDELNKDGKCVFGTYVDGFKFK